MSTMQLKVIGEERGSLVALEALKNVPFDIKRVYYLYGVQPDLPRGFHAHRETKQLAICVSGTCRMLLDDGKAQTEVILNSPNKGCVIESMVWHEMHDMSADCILLVLADTHYSENDYIRCRDHFNNLCRR